MKHLWLLLCIFTLFACEPTQEVSDQTETQESSQKTPLDSLNEKILDDPNNPDLFLERARLFNANDSLDLAMQDIMRALRIDSTLAEAHYMEGDLLYISKAVDMAIDEFEICLKYDENHVGCLLRKAEIDMLLRNYPSALKLINRALRIDDFQPEAYYMKGLLYKETGDTSLAVSSYITATELDPNFYDGFVQIGLLYSEAHSDLAIEYFNSALEIVPNSVEALYAKAMYLQNHAQGRSDFLRKAMDLYHRIDEIDTSNAASPFNRGFIYLEYKMQYDSAAMEFSEAIARYPQYFQAFYNRGLCFESMDKLDKALNDYNKALRIKPDYTPAAIAKGRVLDGR